MTNKYHLRGAAVSVVALILTACVGTSQHTSGASYLEKYEHPAYAAQTETGLSTIDQDVREIAAIEPRLVFPARIGLVRIENGVLTSVPGNEGAAWQGLAEELGDDYGTLVPVSPLIAAMVARPSMSSNPAKRVVDEIRRGSARQHLDYVLIYEVTEMSGQTSNALRAADLLILGLYVLPSRNVKMTATASAMLIDVRNGYPYGSASTFAEESALTTFAGSGTARTRLSERSRVQAVENLTEDVKNILLDLKTASILPQAD